MPNVDDNLKDTSRPESSNVAIEASQTPRSPTHRRIECTHRVLLDVVSKCDPCWDCVGQIEEGRSRYDTDEIDVGRDCGGDDKRDTPPDRNNCGVKDLPSFRSDQRSIEDVDQDVIVENFDADVSVQRGGDQTAQEGKCVACRN